MESFLTTFVTDNIAIYMMVFARIGTAMMIMPGIGDSFVSARVRLLFAMAFSVVVATPVASLIPSIEVGSAYFLWVMMREVFIGLFIGTVMRIFMTAVDTGGMLISMQTGLGNAMVFNPQMAGQGSIIGAFLSVAGAVLLFATDMHHILIYALIESYQTFPTAGEELAMGGIVQIIAKAVSESFAIGFYMSVPFIMVALLLYIAMGVLGRLMPQIQVFILALPVQILLGFLTLFVVGSTVMLYWLTRYDDAIRVFMQEIN